MQAMVGGLVLGAMGSLHCLGMCGPIALALPAPPSAGRRDLVVGRVLYNLGRVVTYAVLGAVMGAVGQFVHLAGWQQGLSIAAGAIILLVLLTPKRWWLQVGRVPWAGRLFAAFQQLWRRWFGQASWSALFTLGVLNGLLPCGLVYLALAAAMLTGSWLGGLVFMASFGLGTAPAMLVLGLVRGVVRPAAWPRLRRVVPIVAGVLGVLFIVRGLALGIPYLSPDLAKRANACPMCETHGE